MTEDWNQPDPSGPSWMSQTDYYMGSYEAQRQPTPYQRGPVVNPLDRLYSLAVLSLIGVGLTLLGHYEAMLLVLPWIARFAWRHRRQIRRQT